MFFSNNQVLYFTPYVAWYFATKKKHFEDEVRYAKVKTCCNPWMILDYNMYCAHNEIVKGDQLIPKLTNKQKSMEVLGLWLQTHEE